MPHRPISEQLTRLERNIDYVFKDKKYLLQAITHKSKTKNNYERLEFLGDSLLSAIISITLYKKFPLADEGELSRLRTNLVKGDTLAEIGKILNLQDFIQVGIGEMKSGGYRRESITADVFESIIAAVFLDTNSFNDTELWLSKFFADRLSSLKPSEELKDSKSRLQEKLQSSANPVPKYVLKETKGPEHNRVFYVSCDINLKIKGSKDLISKTTLGEGSSKKIAEQDAAKRMLKAIEKFSKKS